MPKKISTISCGAVVVAFGAALAVTPAYAGFQWVSPNDAGGYAAPAVSSYAPPAIISGATMAPEVISPVVISGDSAPDMSISRAVPPSPAPSVPEAPAKKNTKIDLATETISTTPFAADVSASSDVVRGFASQVPFALALRQILPAGYSFSIDQDVSMDTLVSYKGGKPWGETLRTMLAAAGLTVAEQGSVVAVSRVGGEKGPSFVAPAPSLPPVTQAVRAFSSDAPVINMGAADGWSADRGGTLRGVLTEWCRRAGVELQWLAEYDYPLSASAHFNGGFEDAVRNLLAGFDAARPQPIGELHTNSGAGQRVLVVQARGNSYSN